MGVAFGSLALDKDGKILIGGDFSAVNGIPRNRIARLNSDGTLDTSFNANGFDGRVRSVTILEGGAILVTGDFGLSTTTGSKKIARLGPAGTLDAEFKPAALNYNQYVAPVTSNGKVIVALSDE